MGYKTDNVLKIAHINIRSLLPKFGEIKNFILGKNYDVVGISETWLSPLVNNVDVEIPGYTFIRKDRPSRGGGVGLYVKDCYKYTIVTDKYVSDYNTFEQIWIKLTIKKEIYIAGCIYRPPSCNLNGFIIDFEQAVLSLIPQCNVVLCTGDFNINLLDVSSTAVNNFQSLIDSAGLKQIITSPTRITGDSMSLVDLILINSDLQINKCGTISLADTSDHELVFCELANKISKTKSKIIEYRDFKNLDYEQFLTDLKSIPWKNIYDIENIDDKISFVNDNLMAVLNIHAPRKFSRITKNNSPWLTENIKTMIRLRNKALARFKNSQKPEHWEYYKSLRNITTNTLRLEKKAFLESRLHKTKNVWSELKKFDIGKNKNNTNIPSSLNKPDDINDFFISSIPQLPKNNELINYYNQNLKNGINTAFEFKEVTDLDIYKVILSIKSNAKGIDDINIKTILLCCPFLLPIITHIINFCIRNSVYPRLWKQALVTPLPKINEPVEFKDLRPISILPCMSKILEKIINQQFQEYVENNNILPQTQSGFRRNHSCVTALANVTDNIMRATDEGKITVMTLLDFSKAFDTLDHATLLSILHFIGLKKKACKFFTNYLVDRSQCVRVGNQKSSFLPVTKGTPQGSILSPLLYAVYTSNFTNVIQKCSVQYYADDTQLYFSFYKTELKESCNIINEELKKMKETSSEHSLLLNPSKCSVMIFGMNVDESIKSNIDIKIENNTLPIKNSVRNLGLIFDSALRFSGHISSCIQRAFGRLKHIFSIRQLLSEKLKVMLCDTLVLSIFNYADVVYGNCLKYAEKRRIQLIQNACLRVIHKIRKFKPISHTLKYTNWLSMENRRKLHEACFYQKIIHYKSPSYLFKKIIFRSHVHNVNIRYRGTITPPIHKTTLFERSFTYNIAKLYNSIPKDFKIKPPPCFKANYRKYLFHKQNLP